MPALSPTMSQGNIASWKVKVGQEIAAGDVLAEVETDKATMDWENQANVPAHSLVLRDMPPHIVQNEDDTSAQTLAMAVDFLSLHRMTALLQRSWCRMARRTSQWARPLSFLWTTRALWTNSRTTSLLGHRQHPRRMQLPSKKTHPQNLLAQVLAPSHNSIS